MECLHCGYIEASDAQEAYENTTKEVKDEYKMYGKFFTSPDTSCLTRQSKRGSESFDTRKIVGCPKCKLVFIDF